MQRKKWDRESHRETMLKERRKRYTWPPQSPPVQSSSPDLSFYHLQIRHPQAHPLTYYPIHRLISYLTSGEANCLNLVAKATNPTRRRNNESNQNIETLNIEPYSHDSEPFTEEDDGGLDDNVHVLDKEVRNDSNEA